MAKKENSFAYLKLESDDLDLLWDTLSTEGYAQVIHFLHVFVKEGTDPVPPLDGVALGMYLMIKQKQIRAKEKYAELCLKRAENGAKGGKAKAKNAQAKSADAAQKFKPPTLKQFKNVVDHYIETEELDEDDVSDYDVEKFFSELDESGWKIGSEPIRARKEWEKAIVAKFYIMPFSPISALYYQAFVYIFSSYHGLRDDGESVAEEVTYNFVSDYDEDAEGWIINDHTFTRKEWKAAVDAYVSHRNDE